MANKIQWRRDTAANWTAVNPVLSEGMPGYEKDTGRLKIGDGVTPWTSLPYSFEGVTDHGALTGLLDDDHPQYLNETRGDIRYYTKVQLDGGQLDTRYYTEAEINTLLATKYDASNPAGYETPAELNVRDAANRDRANHTGTQLASTISDFTPAVQAAETTTSLSLSSNILTFTDEDGGVTNIDLSVYLDDTNLARLVSGTVDGAGIGTFTRDDGSTFTVDFSSLFDDTNLARIVSGSFDNGTKLITLTRDNATTIDIDLTSLSTVGSIDDLSDVDTSTNAPNIGDFLEWDGRNWVPSPIENDYTIFPIWAEEGSGLANNSRQWSFGNGATGNINIVIPVNCELFAVSFDCATAASQASMEIMIDDAVGFTTKTFTAKDFELIPTPIGITAGQCLGFRTDIEFVSGSNARVCAWLRIRSSALSTSVLNDLLDVNAGTPVANQVLQYDGTSWVATTLTAAAVGLGNVDNTSDADKPVSTAQQAALDLKYDASNPDGYITSTAISDFETSAQLDVRDAANRDRSNHTGTQLASTISDFNAAVTAAETNTSLSLASNILSYTDEAGATTNIDLSLYLDDTNLARIVSGTLDAGTGIITFTRDDATTFTIDASALLDNQTAAEVPVTPTGNLTSTNVQSALVELQVDVDILDVVKITKVASTDNNLVRFDGTNGDVQDSNVTLPDSGNLGIDVDDPIHNIQIGEQFNDAPVPPARLQNTEIAQYAGTAINNGTAQIGLYESVPSGFPGDYGARIRYDASTNLLLFTTVQAGVETIAFTFDRATQTATFNGIIDGGTNQAKNFADPTDDQDLATKAYVDQTRSVVKIVNNAATGNLNTGVASYNSFTATDVLGLNDPAFTPSGTGVTCNFTGVIRLDFNCELDGASTRGVVGFRWHNDTQGTNGPWVQHTYIRNASGHTESSANFSTLLSVTNGDVIQIQHDNFAGGGTITSPANGTELCIQRVR